MALRYVLSDYLEQALAQAVYDKLEDGTFSGRIPACPGSPKGSNSPLTPD